MNLSKLHLHWRSCRRDKKEYKSYSLARAYRSEGKNRKEIVLKLGKLSDLEVLQWRSALRAAKNPIESTSLDLKNIGIASNSAYLDIAVILEAWNFWELNSVFDSSGEKDRSIPLSSIAVILAANRCLNPASKSRASSWAQQTTLPFLLDIPKAEINPRHFQVGFEATYPG